MKDAQSLFAKMYEQAGGAAGQAGPGPQAGAGADPNATYNSDDVVDADYKEVQTNKACLLTLFKI